jgi:hypothetical protein
LTTTRTRQVNRLRALLLTGDDTDRALARGALTVAALQTIIRCRGRLATRRKPAFAKARRNGWPERFDRQTPSWPTTLVS